MALFRLLWEPLQVSSKLIPQISIDRSFVRSLAMCVELGLDMESKYTFANQYYKMSFYSFINTVTMTVVVVAMLARFF